MRIFALYGIGRHHDTSLICVIQAETLEAAAERLGATLERGEKHPWHRLYFDPQLGSSVLIPGPCTAEIAAAAANRAGSEETDLCARLRWHIANEFKLMVIGVVPMVP